MDLGSAACFRMWSSAKLNSYQYRWCFGAVMLTFSSRADSGYVVGCCTGWVLVRTLRAFAVIMFIQGLIAVVTSCIHMEARVHPLEQQSAGTSCNGHSQQSQAALSHQVQSCCWSAQGTVFTAKHPSTLGGGLAMGKMHHEMNHNTTARARATVCAGTLQRTQS
jgi:hypothetical protein